MGGSQKESLHNQETPQNQIKSPQAPYVACQGTLNPKPCFVEFVSWDVSGLQYFRVWVLGELGAQGYLSSWGGQQATVISGFMLLGADHSPARMNAGNCSHSQLSAGRVTCL